MNKRKNIFNAIFLFIVFFITIYSVFHGNDLSEIISYIKNANGIYWLVAVFCVIFFIGSESIIIFYMMRTIEQKVTLLHCLLYSFVGFFFCCITPASLGGQPAQIYYMKKDKIPIPIATLVLMIVTITYKMVLVVIGAIVFLIRPVEVMKCLSPVMGICILGFFLNFICIVFMILLVFHPTLAYGITLVIVKLFQKLHLIKNPEKFLSRLERAMQQYKDVAVYFKTHKMVVWNVFIITIVQRLLLFFITYLTYCSFGLKKYGVDTIVLLQGMISVAVEMLPLPGGMGISEKLFLEIFAPIFGTVTLPAMIVSRGLSYYTQLIISALFTIVAYVFIGKNLEGKN
jgi:uncharacterized protein (TIRG00374 family)